MSSSAELSGTMFVRPGDLHLEDPTADNTRCARWMVDEINRLVKPSFVQFAGDNVQNAKPKEFKLFLEIANSLQAPWKAMVGDHDILEDTSAAEYRAACGATYESFEMNGTLFIRLNSCEYRPVGFGDEQLDWFESELHRGHEAGLRIVVFQHHYPFKVCESFDGVGIARWKKLVQENEIEIIFTGHTHYGQIANDGQNLSVATRSIGDPEGGESGYHIIYVDRERLALTYRTRRQSGPILLPLSPRSLILTKNGRHVVKNDCEVDVLVWSPGVTRVFGTLDDGPAVELKLTATNVKNNKGLSRWSTVYSKPLKKGVHRINLTAESNGEMSEPTTVEFFCDPTGRFTAVPRVDPPVSLTAYC